MNGNENSCAFIFKARRERIWRSSRPWILVGLIGFAIWAGSAIFLRNSDPFHQVLGFGIGFLFVFPAAVVITGYITKNYRCPRCNAVPMAGGFFVGTGGIGYQRGLMLFPKACPSCGAPFV